MTNVYQIGSRIAGVVGSQIPSLVACAILTGGDLEKTVQYHLINAGIRWTSAILVAGTWDNFMTLTLPLMLPEYAGYAGGRYVYGKIDSLVRK